MNTCRRIFLWLTCLGALLASCYGQETNVQPPTIKVDYARQKDLKRTARRLGVNIERLTNLRTALKEATELALRQDPPMANDYVPIARQWIQANRKEALPVIASMIEQVSKRAQMAEDLAFYRQCTTQGQQLLYMLFDLDMERARQIADLWPAPSAKLGQAGEQALIQFQSELNARLLSQGSGSLADGAYTPYVQPQVSATLPFAPRLSVAAALAAANQKEKARAVLDQAIADLGNRPPDPSKNNEYEAFLRGMVSFYPERCPDALEAYKSLLSRQDNSVNPGVIYVLGEDRVSLNPAEAATLNMVRALYGRPELAAKILSSDPGLRAKLDQLGGIDNILSPSPLSSAPAPKFYPANNPPPVMAATLPGAAPNNLQNSAAPEKPLNPSELLRSLRGKAELNPVAVRRKLADTCQKKEHFPVLISLAQVANYTDPDLSSIALDVAHGLLPAFESLQQRSSSLRSLISALRQIEGEVDPTLLREGFILVTELREEEKNKEQAAAPTSSGAGGLHPSDDFELFLIAQNALDDFGAALSRVHAIEDEYVRIKALLQIAQALTAYN